MDLTLVVDSALISRSHPERSHAMLPVLRLIYPLVFVLLTRAVQMELEPVQHSQMHNVDAMGTLA